MIKIVAYGSGNIKAIQNIYKCLNIDCEVAVTPEALKSASKLILPGVGAFDETMIELKQSGMLDALNEAVLVDKKPVLGICVGMQVLANSSEEGTLPGLGWIDAEVKKFDAAKISSKPKLPHMGWNNISIKTDSPLFKDIDSDKGFYFLHSYYFSCVNDSNVAASANYHGEFTCAAFNKHIYGVQFHPEKSHSNGIAIFKNFAEL